MRAAISSLLVFLSGLLGAAALVPHGGAFGIAVTVLAIAIVVLASLSTMHGASAASSRAHPSRAIDESRPLAQSDPDAAGHTRPRAPGRAVPAA